MSHDSRFALDGPAVPGVVVAAADPTARAAFAAALAAAGFAVWPAASGLDALNTFLDHTGEVDAVLLDAALPDLPGAEVARRLHAHFPGVPCVFVGEPQEAAGLRDRGERALTRPPGPAAVVAAVRGAIGTDAEPHESRTIGASGAGVRQLIAGVRSRPADLLPSPLAGEGGPRTP